MNHRMDKLRNRLLQACRGREKPLARLLRGRPEYRELIDVLNAMANIPRWLTKAELQVVLARYELDGSACLPNLKPGTVRRVAHAHGLRVAPGRRGDILARSWQVRKRGGNKHHRPPEPLPETIARRAAKIRAEKGE